VRKGRISDKTKTLTAFYLLPPADRPAALRSSSGVMPGKILEIPLAQSVRNALICVRDLGVETDIPYFVSASATYFFSA
jgi:hypothetical protein